MENVFLFDKLELALSIDELKKAAEIDTIESGEGYTLTKPIYRVPLKEANYYIEQFVMENGGVLPGSMVIYIRRSNGKEEEHYADWFIGKDKAVKL